MPRLKALRIEVLLSGLPLPEASWGWVWIDVKSGLPLRWEKRDDASHP